VTVAASSRAPVASRSRPGLTRPQRILLGLGAVLVAAILVGCAVGAVPVPLLSVLLDRAELSELHAMVLTELRIPRVMLAAAVGAALATAGAAMQGLFRNPLAEPQLIGVSAGAALGAIAMIVIGEGLGLPEWVQPYSLPVAAIAGAGLVTTGLYVFAARRRDPGMTTMLLVGIAVNAAAGVGIGLFTWIANDGQLRSLTFWSMGSFGSAQWSTALPAMVLICVAVAVLIPGARQLDLLQLGETEARRLGVSVPRLKRRLVFGSAAAVGAGVAVSGVIGFVGLVVPHIARMLGGVHHAYLLPASALLGASLAVGAELGARTFVAPAEMPVGLITSAIGAPFFLWLIARMRAR
jgi:iron complex transport system permease protein